MIETKESGIAWIGKTPSDWKFIKGKYILHYLQKPIRKGDGVITCFRDGEVTLRSNRREEGFTLADKEIGYQGIDIGDLVVHGMDGFAGSIGISDSRGKASPVLNVLDTHLNKKYVMYYLRSMAYSDVFLALATGIRVRSCDLRWNKLAELVYPVPPRRTQDIIAAFLDKKMTEINELQKELKEQIETLESLKKNSIIEAVSKGLNKNDRMKDSGVFYIGPVNERWEITKLEYICEKLYRKFDNSAEPLICSNKGKVLERGDTLVGLMSNEDSIMQGIHVGDIAIHGMDTWHGAIALSDKKGKITKVVHVCQSNEDNRFVVYYLQSLAFRGVYKLITNGVRGNTSDFRSWDKTKNIYIALPNLEEQNKICDKLDILCKEIEDIVSAKANQIKVLEEYRRSLVYEYVTGKKEVPAV